MRVNQLVADMTDEVLGRQVTARAWRTGESFEDAPGAVLHTEAGRQELCGGPHRHERAGEWQTNVFFRGRAEERAGAPGWRSPREASDPSTDG